MSKYDKVFWEPKTYISEAYTKNFDEPVTGLAVKLSGGADSSIIYYTLCKEMQELGIDVPLYVVTLDVETKDWYSHYAKKVIDYTEEKTGIRPKEHLINYLSLPWTVPDYEVAQEINLSKLINTKQINVYYGGLTQNPARRNMAKAWNNKGMKMESYWEAYNLCKEGADPDRNNNSTKQTIGYGRSLNQNHNEPFLGVLPFVQKDKRDGTAALYKTMGVTNELLPLTYSCEEDRQTQKIKLDIVDGYQEYSHCGKCWFCLERSYAFGRLV